MNPIKNRISWIDGLRGFVMVIMVLDHTRQFLHTESLTGDPLDLTSTSPFVFFTRWITHICAPAFVYLAGASAFFRSLNHNDHDTKRYLRTRGAFLVLLELTVVNFAIWFDLNFSTLLFQVIGAIGIGFIVLSVLFDKPLLTIGIVGAAITVLHQLVLFIPLDGIPLAEQVVAPLFQPRSFNLGNDHVLIIGYPPIPWVGIILIGYASISCFMHEEYKQRLWIAGASGIMFFVVVRVINVYGDPNLWQTYHSPLLTILSFLNVSKYPPSLLYSSLMIGLAFIAIALLMELPSRYMVPLVNLGREPLFFYIVHLYVLHVLLITIMFLQGYSLNELNFGPFGFGRPQDGAGGVSLPFVYLLWITVVIILYPMCMFYSRFKLGRKFSTV